MTTPRIFVSHSHQDNAWCSQLVDALTLAGYDVWFDKQGLYVGDQWISKLETELESRDVFLAVLTPESWASAWVRREVQLAIHSNKRILGVKHKAVELSGFITTYQILEAVGLGAPQVAQQISATLGNPTPIEQVSVASVPEKPLVPDFTLRFDGLYATSPGSYSGAQNEVYVRCLRFYADRRVATGAQAFQSDQPIARAISYAARWIAFDQKKVANGHYVVRGNRLRFMTDSLAGYEGTIEPGGEVLDLYFSRSLDKYEDHFRYTFVPVTFSQ